MFKQIKNKTRQALKKYPELRHRVKLAQRTLSRIESGKTYYENTLSILKNINLSNPPKKYDRPQGSLIEITNSCNLNCTMCNTKPSTRPAGLMEPEVFERIIKQLKSAGVSSAGLHTVGETFIYKDLKTLFKIARKHDFQVWISTNAQFPSSIEPLFEEFPEVFTDLRISIDGATKETFEHIRVDGSFEKVFEISQYFRAEKSNTTRHLNEFVSIDFEWSYKNNSETMDLCENLVKYLINNLIKNNSKELELLNSDLNNYLNTFDRITYEDVINDLNSLDSKKDYGDDITEHDLVILSAKHKSFYFITDWPSNIKPFYISSYEDSELSMSFDLQFSNIELSSGGVRIHDVNKLKNNIERSGLDIKNFESHLQTFKWGMPPHSGLGLGFDRLIMVLANRKNIREAVLYPRDQDRLDP